MESRKRLVLFLGLMVIMVISTMANATPIVFTASGTAASDGRNENAMATFDFNSPTQMTIILKNTAGVDQLGGISSVLDGLKFTFSSAPTVITLDSVTAAGNPEMYSCSGSNCSETSGGSSPYGWTIAGTSNPFLAAGGGSYKPYGIVNDNITATDGITNSQHNPYLNGPVTFTFTLTGLTSVPNIVAADFYFGTEPDIQHGEIQTTSTPTPEPATLLLMGLGSGVMGAGIKRLRNKFKKA
jgi:hypothetical protein